MEERAALREAVRGLIGSAGPGVGLWARLCKEMEEQAKGGVLTNTVEMVAQIEAEYARVALSLEHERYHPTTA